MNRYRDDMTTSHEELVLISGASTGMGAATARELASRKITVNAIAPGFIDTEMTRATAIRLGRDPEEWKEERAKEIPVRRAGVPRDIANLIAFLCSDEASFISGQVIYVAGGPRS